jgi:hypothetical protein
VVDGENNVLRKYLNGTFVGEQSLGNPPQGGLDGRWALTPGGSAELFTDNDGEVSPGYLNSLQFHDVALNTGQLLALGRPTAAGIPSTIPPIPAYIESSSPSAGSTAAAPSPNLEVTLNAGDSTVTADSVRLLFDGLPVSATVTPSGTSFVLQYQVPGILDPESAHRVGVAFSENGTVKTNTFSFAVGKYQNVTLPEPFFLETFDDLEENPFGPGPLPSGWSIANQTAPQGEDYDLDVRSSKSYQDWVLISADRFSTWNTQRTALPSIVLNGTRLESLASGHLMWAESDQRCGDCHGQFQELFTADIDCTGRTNGYVAYHSIYEQNQDNMNAVEYSVDGGANWLPVLYLFCTQGAGESSDIMYKDAPEGQIGTVIDAVRTFERTDNNRAWGPPPPAGGSVAGTNYGAMIKAPISDALAPYIKGYLNDDVLDGKRIEVVRLPQADGKRVKFRFLNTGTSAWFWGIDNLGLYEINTPVITSQPGNAIADFGGSASFNVAATGAQSYQWLFEGAPIANATNATLQLDGVTGENAGTPIGSRYGTRMEQWSALLPS